MSDKNELLKKYENIDSKAVQEKNEILDTLKARDELYVDDHIVKASNLCIVLSCPGEEELTHNIVCYGETGIHLDFVLDILTENNKLITKENQSENEDLRYSFSILNASNNVYFRKYNGAEASDKEILSEQNINRIKNSLKDLKIDYFILCGDKAELLTDLLKELYPEASFSNVCHLGSVGIRNEYKTKTTKTLDESRYLKDIDESKRDDERLKIIAKKILNDFENEV